MIRAARAADLEEVVEVFVAGRQRVEAEFGVPELEPERVLA